MLNLVEMFEAMVAHLHGQQWKHARRERSQEEIEAGAEPYECLYRTPDGCACAIGGILPDEVVHAKYFNTTEGERSLVEYNPSAEMLPGEVQQYLLTRFPRNPDHYQRLTDDEKDFLAAHQELHDRAVNPEHMRERFRRAASCFKGQLSPTTLAYLGIPHAGEASNGV